MARIPETVGDSVVNRGVRGRRRALMEPDIGFVILIVWIGSGGD